MTVFVFWVVRFWLTALFFRPDSLLPPPWGMISVASVLCGIYKNNTGSVGRLMTATICCFVGAMRSVFFQKNEWSWGQGYGLSVDRYGRLSTMTRETRDDKHRDSVHLLNVKQLIKGRPCK
jgi:hypothetical protein